MTRYHIAITRDIDDYIKKADLKEAKSLDKQKQEAIAEIDALEKLLLKNGRRFSFELKQIEKIKRYVLKYKWIPPSYRKMLNQFLLSTLE